MNRKEIHSKRNHRGWFTGVIPSFPAENKQNQAKMSIDSPKRVQLPWNPFAVRPKVQPTEALPSDS